MIDIQNPNISLAKYVIKVGDTEPSIVFVIHNGNAKSIPMDENNLDYQTILRQVADGTLTIADAD